MGASCTTTTRSVPTAKLAAIDNSNLCYGLNKSNVFNTLTDEEADLIYRYFTSPTKEVLKYPEKTMKKLGCK